jgi:hypothetical protein
MVLGLVDSGRDRPNAHEPRPERAVARPAGLAHIRASVCSVRGAGLPAFDRGIYTRSSLGGTVRIAGTDCGFAQGPFHRRCIRASCGRSCPPWSKARGWQVQSCGSSARKTNAASGAEIAPVAARGDRNMGPCAHGGNRQQAATNKCLATNNNARGACSKLETLKSGNPS